jgi:O-antigen/teichoic acid export membrane protein
MIYAMLKEGTARNVARIEQFQAFYFHTLLGLAIFVSVFSPEIFALLVDAEYHQGIGIVPVIAFAFVFGGVRKLYATLVYYHKWTLLISIGGITQALLSLGMNVVLIPRFGGIAAAWSKLVSMAIVAAYFWVISRRCQPLRIDWSAVGVTLLTAAACLGVLGVAAYVLQLSFWPLAGVKVAVALLAIAITWYSRFGSELRKTLFPSKRAAPAEEAPADKSYDSISEDEEA